MLLLWLPMSGIPLYQIYFQFVESSDFFSSIFFVSVWTECWCSNSLCSFSYHRLTLPYRVSVTAMANDICRPWYCCHEYVSFMTGAASRTCFPSGATDFTSGFHRGSCCPVICVSLFPVIFLYFVFWVLIVPFVWLLGIYIYFLL